MIRKTVEYIKVPKKIFYSILIFLGLAFLAFSLRPQKVLVDATIIKKGLFQKTITDEGFTNFKVKHTISAPADGIIPTHDWKAGNEVKKKQKLFKFEWDRDFYITSPLDGFILQVFEKDRKHVVRGTPILEVGSPESVEIIAAYLSEEVLNIKKGQKALITNWGGDKPLSATVSEIEPQAREEISALGVKEKRVNVHLDILTDRMHWKSLGDGFRVEVSILVNEIPNVLLIPIGSLFSKDGQPAIFVIENDQLKLTPVEIGDRNQEFALLLSQNLQENVKVVLYPGSTLKNGDKIKVRN